MRRSVVAAALLVATAAHAGCTARDSWGGADKAMHFAGTALASAFVGAQTDPTTGLLVGIGAAIGKEAIDATGLGNCSLQDAAWGIAGAFVGAAGARWVLIPQRRGVAVAFSVPM